VRAIEGRPVEGRPVEVRPVEVRAVEVRGNATAEELAAVLAVLTHTDRAAVPDAYRRWRDTRLAALKRRTAGR
jgi:hypothetical protein